MSKSGKKENEKTSGVSSQTQTVTVKKSPNVVLKLQTSDADASSRRVQWDQTAVDNEYMNKKKSKCCCIYTKPKAFDESGSESEDDDHNCTAFCRGHLEKDFKHDEKEKEPSKADAQQSNGSTQPPNGSAQPPNAPTNQPNAKPPSSPPPTKPKPSAT